GSLTKERHRKKFSTSQNCNDFWTSLSLKHRGCPLVAWRHVLLFLSTCVRLCIADTLLLFWFRSFPKSSHRQADQAKRRVSEPSGVCSPQVTVSWPIAPLQCTSCVHSCFVQCCDRTFLWMFSLAIQPECFLLEN